VPGWPIGFGDEAKAGELLQKALTLTLTGSTVTISGQIT